MSRKPLKLKRTLALLLTFVLCLGMLPAGAFAQAAATPSQTAEPTPAVQQTTTPESEATPMPEPESPAAPPRQRDAPKSASLGEW